MFNFVGILHRPLQSGMFKQHEHSSQPKEYIGQLIRHGLCAHISALCTSVQVHVALLTEYVTFL